MKTSISTDILAWWGAVVSRAVVCWDVYKWRSAGPKLRFGVWPDTIQMPSVEPKRYIRVQVANTGDRSTTLQNLTIIHFENKRWSWKRLRQLPHTWRHVQYLPWSLATTTAVVKLTHVQQTHRIPVELKPGAVWESLVEQRSFEEKFSEGTLYFELHHSHSSKPLRKRLIFHPSETTN